MEQSIDRRLVQEEGDSPKIRNQLSETRTQQTEGDAASLQQLKEQQTNLNKSLQNNKITQIT